MQPVDFRQDGFVNSAGVLKYKVSEKLIIFVQRCIESVYLCFGKCIG